ncbi:MAG: cytochrome c maturation protein CcmE [Algoriphagus sp.]|jgi:cytochrome c-type biogenesis protein CcmE|uniref:cytochrome c maturation protein CcmE domain-containing protein n=1 Tax=Algoriphagus sp. TaxID=1872435 RepID=UPI0027212EE4|nr:cytochrome c maturation protein CcmE [Algoriphagus sp.]MDO8965524.1 cytochrome c maturation protein CcmE [Algoriphagus sp.]MDP2042630.1 cytochrome c maturation protein CcmE [Algoriphagus sp.]MDP3201564.1 cytochrome c maturation protein CcmE [Algoriphagus sp.]MDP3471411.1 cytochrome c maturation protein CcmE [Algoriphagus sp.]
MKKGHIIGLGIIAIAIVIIMTSIGDASSYENFKTAWEMKEGGEDKSIHVVGQLKKDATGQVTGLEVREDKTSFTFLLIDNEGTEQKVFYNEPVPADFQRSEQVVVIGSYREKEIFVADKILMKCPSKYQETDVKAAGM